MDAIERRNRKPCVLVTGFGRFPGAAFNPSEPLARALSRVRRPSMSDMQIIGHVFPTSYAAVDRDLPALLEKYRPDIVLMFGVAPKSKAVRIEMRARNALSRFPDATRFSPASRTIAAGAKTYQPARAPLLRMLNAARQVKQSSVLSRTAGRYLCNYLYWRALEASHRADGPKIVAFVHVPPVRKSGMKRSATSAAGFTSAQLRAVGEAILVAMAQGLRTRAAD
jgi:pyroglutamyl-peptidase